MPIDDHIKYSLMSEVKKNTAVNSTTANKPRITAIST
jgi:hypothetical protein